MAREDPTPHDVHDVTRRGRALVIANRLPYPIDDGWKRRTHHVLTALSRRYRVTLVSLHGREPRDVSAAVAQPAAVDVQTVRRPRLAGPVSLGLGLVTRRPFHVWRVHSAAMRRIIARAEVAEPFDVAIATLVHLAPYLDPLDRRTLRVVDTHNIDSLVLRRYAPQMSAPRAWYARMSAGKLARHESRAFRDADLVWVCSEEERDHLAGLVPAARVVVIPNGVDTALFSPVVDPPMRGRLVFFGRLDYFPNADAVVFFAREILPLIRQHVPHAELVVAGPGAGSELRGMAERTTGLRLVGPLADLRPLIASAEAVVVPLRSGGGTRLKILEALAMAKAVVSTSLGAEGLALRSGREAFIADLPEAFARAVVEVLRDADARDRVGSAGRDRVRESYDWSGIETRMLSSISAAGAQEPGTIIRSAS